MKKQNLTPQNHQKIPSLTENTQILHTNQQLNVIQNSFQKHIRQVLETPKFMQKSSHVTWFFPQHNLIKPYTNNNITFNTLL